MRVILCVVLLAAMFFSLLAGTNSIGLTGSSGIVDLAMGFMRYWTSNIYGVLVSTNTTPRTVFIDDFYGYRAYNLSWHIVYHIEGFSNTVSLIYINFTIIEVEGEHRIYSLSIEGRIIDSPGLLREKKRSCIFGALNALKDFLNTAGNGIQSYLQSVISFLRGSYVFKRFDYSSTHHVYLVYYDEYYDKPVKIRLGSIVRPARIIYVNESTSYSMINELALLPNIYYKSSYKPMTTYMCGCELKKTIDNTHTEMVPQGKTRAGDEKIEYFGDTSTFHAVYRSEALTPMLLLVLLVLAVSLVFVKRRG